MKMYHKTNALYSLAIYIVHRKYINTVTIKVLHFIVIDNSSKESNSRYKEFSDGKTLVSLYTNLIV